MLTEKQIKIIKHAERNDSQAVGLDKRRTSVPNLDETKLDAVTIVTGWVSEWRRKKAQDAAKGFQSLFGETG